MMSGLTLIIHHSAFRVHHFPSLSSADVRQEFGGGALEEGRVESPDGLLGVALFDDEGQVDGGGPLGDEQDVYVLYGREDAARDAGRRAQALADDADYRALLFDLDRAHLLKLGDYLRQRPRLFERERDRDLGRGDYVDGRAVALEDLEYRAQEAVRAEHTRRGDVDYRDARLVRDGLDRARRHLGVEVNVGLGALG